MLCLAFSAIVAFELPAARSGVRSRAATPLMKGKGSRGMPGKNSKPGQGFQGNLVKERMMKRDANREEWTLVAAKGELGTELGSTMAVEAGQSPQGTNYIWTLVRGEAGEGEESTVYATDGSCRACQFPMIKGVMAKGEEGFSLTCPTCGSEFNLDKGGEVVKWLPGEGPAQFLAKQLNKDKEEGGASTLPTRVSKSGRIYMRLPDGTLKITKTAAERAEELAKIGSSA
tara:strand:- start:1001 stop:1687 length:687 start_codon:yes stop_codon:yes gene_type:complete